MSLIPSAISRLYKILPKQYKRKFIFASVSAFIMALVDLISLGMLLPVLLLVVDENNLSENHYVKSLYESLGIESNLAFVSIICAVIFLISAARTLFNSWMQYVQSKRLLEISRYLSLRLYGMYYSNGFLYIKKNNSLRLINNINAVGSNLIQGYLMPFASLVCESLVVFSILVGLIWFNVYVFLLVFMTFVPISLIYYKYSRNRIQKYGERMFRILPEKERVLQQTFVGYADMEMSNSFPLSDSKFSKLLTEYNSYSVKNLVLNSSLQRVLELAVVCSVIVLVMSAQILTLPRLGIIVGMFVLAIYRILPGIVKSTSFFFTMRGNKFALNLLDDLEKKDEIHDHSQDKPIHFNQSIRVDNISFSYDKKIPVIKDLSLEIKRGDFIGVKGKSGSGKSTFFHLLLGFLKPDLGTISVDNTPLSVEYMTSWRSKIGYVSQQLFMLEGTILDNIVMGVNAAPDRDRIDDVLKLASLDEFVASLPEGVDTNVGEGGCLISGGQRQRLGIARALYKNVELLLFDEATSSLDETTEKAINQAILHLSKQRSDLTLLVISHRSESLSICRNIIDFTTIQG